MKNRMFQMGRRPVVAVAVTLGMLMTSAGVFAAESTADHSQVIELQRPASSNEVQLLFQRDGHPEPVTRSVSALSGMETRDAGDVSTVTQARAMAEALTAGPTSAERAAGFEAFLPEGSTLANVEIDPSGTVKLYLDLPVDFMTSATYTPRFVELAGHHYIDTLRTTGLREFYFYVKDPVTGDYREIRDFLPESEDPGPAPRVEPQAEPGSPVVSERSEMDTKSLPTGNGFVNGALSGKRVVLNQSHGWLDDNSPNRWRVQRTNTWEVLEDYGSPMFMNMYVIPLLQNAGAWVRPVREPDNQTNMVVVDNAMGSPRYTESGSGIFNSSLAAYVDRATYTGLNNDAAGNPFANPTSSRLIPITTGNATASATFAPTIPASGYYNVYITYAAGSDRSTKSHFQVKHSGGVTDFRIDQTRTGGTWVLLGNFYFEKNAPASEASVVALNDHADNSYVNVDAVRFGGGMGNVARRTHGVSGRPRWQEEANNYMQYSGMMSSSLMYNDATSTYDDEQLGWSNRPQYANWEQTRDGLGNNLIYIGWHTNASSYSCSGGVETSGGGRGTSTYRDVAADATANTENLTQKVHDALIASIRATYNSSWQDRGIIGSNNYGENSQGNLGNVAGFFFEGLFHDNQLDAGAYKDGKFRYAAARGIVNGIIQYYGGSVFPPEPVTNFRVKNIGSNKIRLEWNRGAVGNTSNRIGSAASNFRVYTSSNGYGFDNGVNAGNVTSYEMTVTPGQLLFLRVAATNSAGVSIPSETMAARVASGGAPTGLIVNGYHRNDQYAATLAYSSGIGGCGSSKSNRYREMDPRQYQALNYTIQHAKAIAAQGGYGIDSCSNDAINAAQYSLLDYGMVFWISGQQAEADTTDNVDDTVFRFAERVHLANYLQAGGRLMVSGSEIAWDYGRSGVPAANSSFLHNYLKANYSQDNANTYTVNGNAGIFAGLGAMTIDNGTGTSYDVRFPDVIAPIGGATACMSYTGGTGGTAAIQYAGTFGAGTQPGKLVYMGIGFETIKNEADRNDVMDRVIDFFIPAGVSGWGIY